MRRILISSAASERLTAATQFLCEFPHSAEVYVIGGTRAAADECVRQYGRLQRATFGIHRVSLVQLAARISVLQLAQNDQTPCSALGTEATVMRAVTDDLRGACLPFTNLVKCGEQINYEAKRGFQKDEVGE